MRDAGNAFVVNVVFPFDIRARVAEQAVFVELVAGLVEVRSVDYGFVS